MRQTRRMYSDLLLFLARLDQSSPKRLSRNVMGLEGDLAGDYPLSVAMDHLAVPVSQLQRPRHDLVLTFDLPKSQGRHRQSGEIESTASYPHSPVSPSICSRYVSGRPAVQRHSGGE
jgi:hypothetical protein